MSYFEDWADPIIEQLPPSDTELSEIEVCRDDSIPPIREVLGKVEGDLNEINSDILHKSTSVDNNQPSSRTDDGLLKHRKIDREDSVAIEEGVWIYGLESLAFYKSIHFRKDRPFPGKWGIFIFDYALTWLSDEIESFYPGSFSALDRMLKAFKLIHRHERFHFYLDAWVIGHEGIQKTPLYANYNSLIYQRWHPYESCVEESLANRHALDGLRLEGIRDFVTDFMSRQPGAYAKFMKKQETLRADLATQVLYCEDQMVAKLSGRGPSHDQIPFLAYGRNSLINDSACPIYRIHSFKPSSLILPGFATPSLREHEDFVKRYLAGTPASTTDHGHYIIDNGERLKMPNPHKDRLKGTEFHNNRKKAGMTTTEYQDERRRTKTWRRDVPRSEPKRRIM